MRPRRWRPPVECCFGVSPRKAAKWRADLNSVGVATVAAMAEAVMTPTPGIVANRRLASLFRCQARIACSISLMRRCRSPSWSATAVIAIRACGGMRLSVSSLMMPTNSAIRRISRGATIPNSPRQPRIRLASIVSCLTRISRARWSVRADCCSTDLIAAKRIVGRLTASQMPRHEGVALPALHIRLHIAGRHHPHLVTERGQFSCPVMRGRTGFDADQAGRQRGEEGQHLALAQLFAQNHLPVFVDPVSLENVLCHIKANPDYGHGILLR